MSFIDACSFNYDGVDSASFGLKICWINDGAEVSNLSREIISTNINMMKIKTNIYGTRYEDNVSISFYIVKNDFTELDRHESAEINRWLMSPSVPKILYFNDNEIHPIHYYAICTSIEDVVTAGKLHGKKITFKTNSPYGFDEKIKRKYAVTGNKEINFLTEFDSNDNYYYPVFEISTAYTNDIIIENRTSVSSMSINLSKLKSINNAYTVLIDNNNMTVKDIQGKLLPISLITDDIDKFQWIKFIYGKNALKFTGNFSITINCEFPRRIGGL